MSRRFKIAVGLIIVIAAVLFWQMPGLAEIFEDIFGERTPYSIVSPEFCPGSNATLSSKNWIRLSGGKRSPDCQVTIYPIDSEVATHLMKHMEVSPPVAGTWSYGPDESVYFKPDANGPGWKYGQDYQLSLKEPLKFRGTWNSRE